MSAATTQSGRGPSGKLRNFNSMNDAKLAKVLATLIEEDNDAEALAAARAVVASRRA